MISKHYENPSQKHTLTLKGPCHDSVSDVRKVHAVQAPCQEIVDV